MSTEKLAVTLMVSAIHKRTIAETLWAEAEKDMAQARAMLEEINDSKTILEQGKASGRRD